MSDADRTAAVSEEAAQERGEQAEVDGDSVRSDPEAAGTQAEEEVTRGDGEPWEAYARRLEKVIARQRHELRELVGKRKEIGNRQARKKLDRAYIALGAASVRLDAERAAKQALVERLRVADPAPQGGANEGRVRHDV